MLGHDLASTPDEIKELLPYLTEDERKYVAEVMASDTQVWRPLPGPQYMAYVSQADVIGYGGAAGGGKTDLMCGSALTKHTQSLLMRREYTQMKGIVQRMTEILGDRNGYNGQDKTWRVPLTDRTIEFGSVPNLGDELNYQGRPRDLLGIDEATNFLAMQVLFLMGWVRTTRQGQKTQTLLTFNPPTNVQGRWVVDYFAPWLDERYAKPAEPGELRWFAMVEGEEHEVESGARFTHERELIIPTSRTFIPSRITDNPFLVSTGYIATLQRMPEPLRSQMLYGDFKAGMTDDAYQVIPTAWVKAAMARWQARERKPEMSALGVDVARGGKDNTVIAPRYDWWFDKLQLHPGTETPDGYHVAALVMVAHRDNAPIHLDVIGVGASPYDILTDKSQPVYGVDVRNKSTGRDKSGSMEFFNLRSELVWSFRELLDPANNLEVALPPDPELEKELCAFTWTPKGSKVYVLGRDEIYDKIGRSVDRAMAVILAAIDTPKVKFHNGPSASEARRAYRPLPMREGGASLHAEARRAYNPLNRR